MATRRLNTKYSEFFLYTEALCEILPLILLFTAAAFIFGIWSPEIIPAHAPSMSTSELGGYMSYFAFFVPFFLIYRLFSFLWEQRRTDFYLSGARGTASLCAVRLAAALTGELICVIIPLFLRLFVFFNEPFSVLRRLNVICGNAAVAIAVTAFSLGRRSDSAQAYRRRCRHCRAYLLGLSDRLVSVQRRKLSVLRNFRCGTAVLQYL